MGYTWILLDGTGSEMRSSEEFESQEAAESWMGSEWAALRDEGAEYVSLRSDGEQIYRMSLAEG